MAKFNAGVTCPNNTVDFFAEMRYDAESYSCGWATKTNPDNDFDDNRPVYLQVLDQFNIPVTFPNGVPALGLLPGMDINRMSAIEAIKLSLAQNLLNGEWWEIIEDGLGGVIIQPVYKRGSAPPRIIALDPRMCIPTVTKKSDTDMVIVTGYDPPPCRQVGVWKDTVPKGAGVVNPEAIPAGMFTMDEALVFDEKSPCHSRHLHISTTKSFLDPLREGDDVAFGSQTVNPFFDPKAFESVSSWVLKVKGMPEGTGDNKRAKVKYNFAPTTNWLYEVNEKINFVRLISQNQTAGSFCPVEGIEYFSAEIRVSNQDFTDKYGSSWPLLIKPVNVLYLGYKVTQITSFPTGGGDQLSFVLVNPTPELINSSGAAKWTYDLDGDDFVITMYYQPKTNADDWELTLASLEGETVIKIDDQSGNTTLSNAGLLPSPIDGAAKAIISGPDGVGYYATGVWIDFVIDRPSVTVTTTDKTPARPWSDALHIQAAPIVVTDLPAEKAYIVKDGSVVLLDVKALGLSTADSDPTTCQNFETTPEAVMQDLMQGNVINITLPFCASAIECGEVAASLMGYQNYGEVTTYALTCGPDDEPEVGAAVAGYDSNLRIESINYSYNDGSAYTIEVSLGPTFSSVGSWGQSNFGGTYEDESRQGIIIWAGGDGVNYRVKVQGLGEFNAINTQTDVYRVGERVQVDVKNIPKTVV